MTQLLSSISLRVRADQLATRRENRDDTRERPRERQPLSDAETATNLQEGLMAFPVPKRNLWKVALAVTVVAVVAGIVAGGDTADRAFRRL